ncbi:DUF4381 domain-containing protein [Methylobacterium soli]|uniref:DUF4381 domain-containing protein n=1 Tax=Methylobacterium soli TaxID=553447 RepID=A0A6L3SYI4_9HYPH|nr:DUF4381 domain-containing protein [Methylobacterium soli]KAB1079043.1 DUF4381 domain-containing protein [Methylobacterium soli]GJE46377.1 hypothetical protein AEGHOMDF_5580 [Methylobacterium soli]
MNPADLPVSLDGLRGLHLPSAAGTIQGEIVAAVALGFLAALLVGLARALRGRRRASLRRAALRELDAARALAPEARLVAQARLLRRVARTLEGDAATAERGAAWAARLDRIFATDFFGQGAGRVLVDGLYRRRGEAETGMVDAELARLLARIKA